MTGELNPDRRAFLATAAIAGLELTVFGSTTSLLRGRRSPLALLSNATKWFNSPPLTADALRGKVVLVNFWTYTCINWLRQLPYVRAWTKKYAGHGLVVIGVHTPEFGFEGDLENVRRAATDLRVDLPIAVDNDYAIWKGFGNRYWPALYFIDGEGAIRHRQFGEGAYDESESMIRKLLTQSGANGLGREKVAVEGRGIEAPADWDSLASPENYLGSDRTERFVSNRDAGRKLRLNEWTVTGNWTIGKQAIALNEANGRIVCRFHARDLHLVLGPAARGTSVRYRVRIDGQPPATGHGLDIDAQGEGAVRDQRLYQLIRQPRPIVDRQFEIEFFEPGLEAFALTFG